MRAGGGLTAAALAVVVMAVCASPALAVEGTTTLKLNGPGAKALRESGVKIAPIKPAKGGSRRVVFPINAGLAGSTTTVLLHRGGISLKLGKRKVRLSKLRLLLGKRSLVSARLGKEEIDLFKVLRGGPRQVTAAAGTVRIRRLGLKLTGKARKALAKALELQQVRPKRFGTLTAVASKLTEGGAPGGSGSAPGGPAKQSSFCPLPSSRGPDAEPTPPLSPKPPSGAVDVTSASLAWRVRESFIRYIATGEGTTPFGGAMADPPELLPETSTALSYGYRFPAETGGWLDSASGQATLFFSGGLRFQYSGHGIDLSAEKPEIQLKGANSRAVFWVKENGGLAQRQVLVNLDLSRAAAITQSGNSYSYERIPAVIPGGTASSVFAGFYAPGEEFGCLSVSFTTG